MKVCPDCRRCYEDSFDSCVHDRSALAAARPGARLVARKYVLERLLEDAATRSVYTGRHTETDRPYAVKLLQPAAGADTEAAKNFRQRALTTAHLNTRVDHQHVAKTHDYGLLPDGAVYVVTELVGGQSLRRYMDEAGPLPAATAAHIARQVADGLEAAHRQGVAHHDLDPTHIILARGDDERPEVKVVDFGFAPLWKQEAAGNGDGAAENGGAAARAPSGAPAPVYAAPEQLGGQNPDARSDLYSLGAILYEMLSGSRPPDAREDEYRPLPFFAIRADVPVALSHLVSQLLSVRPSARPHSAAEVAQRLRAVEEMIATGNKAAPVPDVQELDGEETTLQAGVRATEHTPAADSAPRAAPVSADRGAPELEVDAPAYEDLDALQEELGADLDGIINAASSPASLRGQARAARPSAAAGSRRPEAAGRPRLARILFTTLAAVITGVAFGLWLTSRSASLPPQAEASQADSAPSPSGQSAAQGETAGARSETAPAETSSNVAAGETPASDKLTPPADDHSAESAQGAADARAAEGAGAPSAKVIEAKPTPEGEARREAATTGTAAGTSASTAPAKREAEKPSEGRCELSVSESSLSIPAGGGAGTISVNSSGAAPVRATTNNWQDIAVFSEPRGGEGGRVRYTVISVSKRPGTFAVNINSPCGTKTVSVTVR